MRRVRLVFILALLVQVGLKAGSLPKPGYTVASSSVSDSGFTIVKSQSAEMMHLTAGDLDADNNLDIVYSGWIFDGFIAYGLGDGTFETPIAQPFKGGSSVAIGYINSDTLLDIVAVSIDSVFVLLNNGDRTFTSTSFPNFSPSTLSVLTTGHLNDDVFLDLVVSPNRVYFGDGSGAFPSSSTLPVETLLGADVSDFNRDGSDDLIVLAGNYARILLNNGSGTFTAGDSIFLDDIALSVSTGNALADFNNDGFPDFALVVPRIGLAQCSTGNWFSSIKIGLVDSAGGLLSVDSLSLCGTTYSVITTDINRDNEMDIVAANASAKQLEIFYGNGDGTFSSATFVDPLSSEVTHALATGDFDRDGNPDLVTAGAFRSTSIISCLSNLPERPIISDEMVTTAFSSVSLEVINPDGFINSRLKRTIGGANFWRLDQDGDGTLDEQSYDYNLQYGEYTFIFRRKNGVARFESFAAGVRINGSQYIKMFEDYPAPAASKANAASDSLVFYLTIDSISLISPSSGATVFDNTPEFDWSGLVAAKSSSIDTYHFQLDWFLDFSSPLYDDSTLSNANYTIPTALGRDSLFYWRFRTYDGASYSDWSREFAVYVAPFFCGDVDNDGKGSDILDLTYLVDFIFRGGPAAPIPENADLNGDGTPSNILDLTFLVDFIFRGGSAATCD